MFPLLHFFPTFTRLIKFRGISVPRAQREPIGKLEQRSIIIITVRMHICISLCCLPSALPYINSTGATLGKEVGKISLRIFSILCVSRINGLKQIRNRLNEVPLVKQKSNYMIGNCNNPSQASASESLSWLPLLPASATEHAEAETALRLEDTKIRAAAVAEVIGEGTHIFPGIIQKPLLFTEDACLHQTGP